MDLVKTSALGAIVFQGEPADVRTYLINNPPADDTIAVYGTQAPQPYTNRPVFATEYLDNFSTVYPGI